MKQNYKKLIWGIVDHCFSSLKPFWPTCHWCIRSWSAFTIYQVPISPYCSDPYSLSDLSQSEGFWLVFTDPSVAWISLSSWGSITHSNGRRQTSGHCSYSLAWSYHKREGQRGSKRGGGGWGCSRAQADWQNHWPSYTGVTWMNAVFSPLLVWLTPKSSYALTEYWIPLHSRLNLQKLYMDGVW